MINPYFCYALSFSIAVVMYALGWSDLYPSLSRSLLSFLIITVLINVLASLQFRAKSMIVFRKIENSNDLAPILVTIFLYGLWAAEFVYAGGIPFLNILLKKPYDYKLFGIPTLHVFIVTFSSFYTIYLFHIFLSQKSYRILLLYAINLLAAVLIYNRGMLLFNLSASTFLFFIFQGNVSLKHLAWGVPVVFFILFFFGVLGSLRVSNESRIPYSNEGFLTSGNASQKFLASGVPAEFFWTYIYTTSPLANLQNNIRSNDPPHISISAFLDWVNNEILFDFISKRVNKFTGKERAKEYTITGPFNASTVYSRSFSYLGWWGLILMACTILILPVFYLQLLSADSPFFFTGLVILNTIFLFMIFENTIRFTGLSFQMVYPILLHVLCRRFHLFKRIFL